MESEYKKTWHSEHEAILQALKDVSRLGILTEAGRVRLLEAKELLLAHLKSEDENLYPALRKAAETDTALKRKLDLFALDMDAIAGMTMLFFKRFDADPNAADLPEKFDDIAAMLQSRVSREENILIKEYEKQSG